MFIAACRQPIIGIVAAFTGDSGCYNANLIIGSLDAILASISTEATSINLLIGKASAKWAIMAPMFGDFSGDDSGLLSAWR